MTYLEKISQEHPEAIGDEYYAGVCGCPVSWNYEKREDCNCFQKPYFNSWISSECCRACWEREIREEEKDVTA